MKNLVKSICVCVLLFSCSSDSTDNEEELQEGNFEYVISGALSKEVKGNDTNFGTTNGEFFVRLTSGTDELVIRILIDPLNPNSYEINPVFVSVSEPPIPITVGDSFADLGVGSTLANDRRSFSSNAGNGGSVTISSVNGSMVSGTFTISLRELVTGNTGSEPVVSIQGSFRAVKQ